MSSCPSHLCTSSRTTPARCLGTSPAGSLRRRRPSPTGPRGGRQSDQAADHIKVREVLLRTEPWLPVGTWDPQLTFDELTPRGADPCPDRGPAAPISLADDRLNRSAAKADRLWRQWWRNAYDAGLPDANTASSNVARSRSILGRTDRELGRVRLVTRQRVDAAETLGPCLVGDLRGRVISEKRQAVALERQQVSTAAIHVAVAPAVATTQGKALAATQR